jgi:hypothetical protein
MNAKSLGLRKMNCFLDKVAYFDITTLTHPTPIQYMSVDIWIQPY